jgi:hypothetical protein
MNSSSWPVDIVRMLENWARWVLQDGGSSRSPYPAYNLEPPGKRAGSVMPTLNGEAEDVDAVMVTLPMQNQEAMRVNYFWPNRADHTNAKTCSCSLSTYRRRLDEGHRLFASAWYKRKGRKAYAGRGVNIAPPSRFASRVA